MEELHQSRENTLGARATANPLAQEQNQNGMFHGTVSANFDLRENPLVLDTLELKKKKKIKVIPV